MTAGALQIRNFHNLTVVKERDISALGSMGPDFQLVCPPVASVVYCWGYSWPM